MKRTKKTCYRILAFILALTIGSLSMVGCGKDDSSESSSESLTKYSITVDSSIVGGEIESSHAKTVAGTKITLEASPSVGYEVSEVRYNGIVITPVSNEYSFTMPAEDVSVTATFVKTMREITIDSSITNGTIKSDKDKAGVGDRVTVTVTADEGYILKADTLKFNSTTIYASNGIYSFVMPEEAVEITAVFEIKIIGVYVVGGTVTAAGSEPASIGNYNSGTVITVTADEVVGKEFVNWADNSVIVDTTAKSFTYTVVDEDLYFTAIFADISYEITVEGGEIQQPQDEYIYGNKVTITADIPSDKQFLYWQVGSASQGLKETDNPFTYTVVEDQQFTAIYDDNIYGPNDVPKLTVSALGNFGQGTYAPGDDVVVRYTEDDYGVNEKGISAVTFDHAWIDQNGKEYEGDVVTIENIQENMVLTPIFKFNTSIGNAHTKVVQRGAGNISGWAIEVDKHLSGDYVGGKSMFAETDKKIKL